EACFGFARRFGTRFASSVGKYSRLYVSQLYNKFRCTLVPSAGLAEVLAGWGVANVVPVNLGVDTAIFAPGARSEQRRAELNIRPDQILLLFAGRLAAEKNLLSLVRAFELIEGAWPGRYRLHFIGEGSLGPDLIRISRGRPSITVQPYVSDPNELARNYR